jgi:hypothetical protein
MNYKRKEKKTKEKQQIRIITTHALKISQIYTSFVKRKKVWGKSKHHIILFYTCVG